MNTISIRQAEEHEINWINSKYQEVGFVDSNFKNEFIVIAEFENKNAGIGRLVVIDDENIELGGIYVFPSYRKLGIAEKIVEYLCEKNPYKGLTIWCLPFEDLLLFYSKFGFEITNKNTVPDEITKKHEWCNSNETYKKKVLLLSKN